MRIFYSAHCGVRTNNPSTQQIKDANAIVRATNVIIVLKPEGLKVLRLDP
jgi:RNase P/RNase MRP subunit p30